MWAAIVGQCTLDGTCVQSASYPQNYGANQKCTVEIDEANAAPIVVETFDVESYYDYLTVNGNTYSGTSGPDGVTPTGSITWSSDFSVQRGGWRFCMLAPAPAPAPTPKGRRPRRLLEEATGSAPAASGIFRSANVRPSGPAPPAEPVEVEVEAGVDSSGTEIGIIVVAAGGSLWTLCLWYVLRKRTSAHCRSGLDDSEAMSLYVNVNGDMEEGTDAPKEAEKFFVHLTKESPEEKNSARVPL
jgi:hypothetical protein